MNALNTPDLIAGVDPGKSGGIAFITPQGDLHAVYDMPTVKTSTGRQAVDPHAVAEIFRRHQPSTTIVEQVATRPGEGPVGAFSFGTSYGVVLGVLAALGLRHKLVRPEAWKKQVGIPAKSDKGVSMAFAKRLVPSCEQHIYGPKGGPLDGRAEAVLIAASTL
jgi:Holliday junction resolvasome RuvABC endonuclease subunit